MVGPMGKTLPSARPILGLVAMALFALWAVGPAQADAAKCGGRKADIVGDPDEKKRMFVEMGAVYERDR